METIVTRRVASFVIIFVLALVLTQGAIAAPGDISTLAGGNLIRTFGGEVRDFDTLNSPRMVIADASSPNDRIIIEAGGNRIRKITGGSITTLAGATGLRGFEGDGGQAVFAKFAEPSDAAFDSASDLYIADSANHRIRKIDSATGIITTVAGDGFKQGNGQGRFNGDGLAALQTSFNYPSGIAIDAANNIYVADRNNHRVRKIDSATGLVTTTAGSGLHIHCGDLSWPNGQSWPPLGDGGPATDACVTQVWSVRLLGNSLYFTDTDNHRIRAVDLSTGIITTIAGSGCKRQYDQYFLFQPQPTNTVTTTTSDSSNRPCRFEGEPSSFTGPPNQCVAHASPEPDPILGDPDEAGACLKEEPTTYYDAGGPGDGVTATTANLAYPRDIRFDSSGNLYIADSGNGQPGCPPGPTAICAGNRIRKVAATGVITTVAGDGTQGSSGDGGPATSAQINQPQGILIAGGTIEIADLGSSGNGTGKIRRVDSTGIVSTIAGTRALLGCCVDDGFPAGMAQIVNPRGIVANSSGDTFISDSDHQRIVKVSASGTISTVAGKGSKPASPISVGDGGEATDAELNFPRGLALDAGGNLYFADTENNRIRKVSVTGTITTVAGACSSSPITTGCGEEGSVPADGDGGPATAAWISRPHDVAVDSAGNLYIAEPYMQRIRKVDTNGIITTIAGSGNICPVIIYSGINPGIRPQIPFSLGPCGRFLPWGTGAYLGDKLPVENAPNDYGKATQAKLNFPMGVAVDSAGNVFVADTANHKVRKVTTDGWITTVAGSGAPLPAVLPADSAYASADFAAPGDNLPATAASLTYPHDVVVDSGGNLYIADTWGARVRKVDASGIITTSAGNGCHYGWSRVVDLINDEIIDELQYKEYGVPRLPDQYCAVNDGGSALRSSLRWPVALALRGTGLLIAEAEAENQTSSQVSSSYPGQLMQVCNTVTRDNFNCTPESLFSNMTYKSGDGSYATHRIRLVAGT